MAENKCCIAEINLLKQKIASTVSEVKKLKEEYKNLLIKNLQSDVVLRQLKQNIETKKYCDFASCLSESCLNGLREIGSSVRDDTKFVGVVLKDLYGGIEPLKEKTLSGRSKTGNKSELTPQKKSVLDSIYKERMKYLPATEAKERGKNLNKIIRNAIDSSNRKK